MTFSALLASAAVVDGATTLDVPPEWMQGRSVFGGLQAAPDDGIHVQHAEHSGSDVAAAITIRRIAALATMIAGKRMLALRRDCLASLTYVRAVERAGLCVPVQLPAVFRARAAGHHLEPLRCGRHRVRS